MSVEEKDEKGFWIQGLKRWAFKVVLLQGILQVRSCHNNVF